MCQQCYVWIYDFVEMMSHSLKHKERLKPYLSVVAREILHDIEPIYNNREYAVCRNLIESLQYDQIVYIESAYPPVKELIDSLEIILESSRLDTREVVFGWLRQVITMIFLGIGSTHTDHSGSFKALMATSQNSGESGII